MSTVKLCSNCQSLLFTCELNFYIVGQANWKFSDLGTYYSISRILQLYFHSNEYSVHSPLFGTGMSDSHVIWPTWGALHVSTQSVLHLSCNPAEILLSIHALLVRPRPPVTPFHRKNLSFFNRLVIVRLSRTAGSQPTLFQMLSPWRLFSLIESLSASCGNFPIIISKGKTYSCLSVVFTDILHVW